MSKKTSSWLMPFPIVILGSILAACGATDDLGTRPSSNEMDGGITSDSSPSTTTDSSVSKDAANVGVMDASVTIDAADGSIPIDAATGWTQQAYVKASNTAKENTFGEAAAISANGNTMILGASQESGQSSGINGVETQKGFGFPGYQSGAAYVYVRNNLGVWTQQAYFKASNAEGSDNFGVTVAMSADGNTAAVGAWAEGSNATTINGDQTNNAAPGAGAVYIFVRDNLGNWTQQAYVKASNAEAGDSFGTVVSLSSDGNTLAVDARSEDSNATGVNGSQSDNTATDSGAVYTFSRSGTTWTQTAYLKAADTTANDAFGETLTISPDGKTLGVGSQLHQSETGALYIFSLAGNVWSAPTEFVATNTDPGDIFGGSISFSSDGSTMAVGAVGEQSNASGVNGNETNNSLTRAGATYVYTRSGNAWVQQAYLKSLIPHSDDAFAANVSLTADGNTLLVATQDSSGTSNPADTSAPQAGSAYVFARSGSTWTMTNNYLKASNAEADDNFGYEAVISADGTTLLITAAFESSDATGINGNQLNNNAQTAGAAYVFTH